MNVEERIEMAQEALKAAWLHLQKAKAQAAAKSHLKNDINEYSEKDREELKSLMGGE